MVERRKSERRKSARHRSFLRASILEVQSGSLNECIIRDISETGARLRFRSPTALSGRVELQMAGRSAAIRAQVAWIDHCEIGLAFDEATIIGSAPEEEDLAGRVDRLENEIAALKRIISGLMRGGDSVVTLSRADRIVS